MSEVNRLVYSVEVTEDKIHIIHLKDVFDPSTVEEFEHVLEYLFNNDHYKVIVNLGRVEFVSSAGWGTCTSVLNQCRNHGGDIVLVGMQPEVFDVFMLLELDTFIEAFPGVENGLKHFRAKSFVVNRANEIVENAREKGKKVKNGAITRERFQLPSDDEFEEENESLEEDIPQDKEEESDAEQPDQMEISENETMGFDEPAPDESDEELAEQNKKTEDQPSSTKENQSPDVARHSTIAEEKEEPDASVVEPSKRAVANQKEKDVEGKSSRGKFFDTEFYFGRPLGTPGPKTERPLRKHGNPLGAQSMQRSSQFGTPTRNVRGDALLQNIMRIIVANPTYGPSGIRLALIKMGHAENTLTRSMIFKKLNEIDLSTRNKRIEFAQSHRT
ncbi:MAG: STAS domain-containing protein [Calditrichaeota bacterium]|nr:MAG: STAS domain-containing protein [Calditrichota bacterium]